jgi:hypothetical protein
MMVPRRLRGPPWPSGPRADASERALPWPLRPGVDAEDVEMCENDGEKTGADVGGG